MLKNEAKWIGEQLVKLDVMEASPILMLGSRFDLYGPGGQSFIYRRIIAPCEDRGVKFIHSDLQGGEGVDVAGDIFDDATLARLKQLQVRTVICANILEHVLDPGEMARRCVDIVEPGGFVIFTVPRNFPYHPAPIDTLYRPDCDQLIGLLDSPEVMSAQQIECGTFFDQLVANPFRLVKHLGQILLFFLDYRRALSALHRNLWLFRNYQVSCVLVRKRPT